MTLTDIMPTLRMSIPDPIDLRHWPRDTAVTVDDVLVQQVSMSRVTDLTGTPMRWSLDQPGAAAAAICTVSAVLDTPCGPLLLVDTDPRGFDTGMTEMVWGQARLIGRVSVAHRRRVEILGDGSHPPQPETDATRHGVTATDRILVDLPRDLTVGDRLVVPGVVAPGVVVPGVVTDTAPTSPTRPPRRHTSAVV